MDERDAAMIAKHFSLTTVRVDLSDGTTRRSPRQAALRALPGLTRGPRPEDPIQIRRPLAKLSRGSRMATLYFLANGLDYLVDSRPATRRAKAK